MKIVAFLPDYNPKHAEILKTFASGIPNAETSPLKEYVECDVAIIFGLVKKAYPPTHDKQVVLDRHKGRSLLVMESAFVKRGEYWAIGWGGIHGDADFNNSNVPSDRWESFRVKTKPWRNRPDAPVLVCGQLPRDTNVQDTDHTKWCRDTVRFFQERDVPVIFRPHPRMDDVRQYGLGDDVMIDRCPKIKKTLQYVRCAVIWNSTSGVDAAIMGVPVIACSSGAMAWPIASHKLEAIDNLRFPSRREWFASLGYSQWTLDEMRRGLPYLHLTSDSQALDQSIEQAAS